MRKRIFWAAALVVLLIAAGSYSNFYGVYPSFSAMKPFRPMSKTGYAASTYKTDTDAYVQKAIDYINAAGRDIEAIQIEIESARKKGVAAIEEYNAWANSP